MTRSALFAVVLLAVVTAACSTNEPGQPVPGDSSGSSAGSTPTDTTTAPPEPTVDLPPRPKDLPIDGIQQPCELITEVQRDDLQVDRARNTTSLSEVYEGQLECALSIEDGEHFLDVRALLVTSEGAEAWLTGERNVDAKATSVDGYGAAHFWIAGGTGAECSTAVDVADGQHIQVSLMMPGQGWTQDKLCETTDRVAAAALTTLRAG